MLRETFNTGRGCDRDDSRSARSPTGVGVSATAFASDLRCGSACKRDPLSGVIGVQQGPLISMV